MINKNGGQTITFIKLLSRETKADFERRLSSFLINEEITERRTEASKFYGCPLS